MASHWLIYTSLVLFSVGLVYGAVNGGQDCACPTDDPFDDSFPLDETAIRDTLSSLGPLRLILRNRFGKERKYTCVTLEFTSNTTYTIQWSTESDNGTFSGFVPYVKVPKLAGDRDHWRVGLSSVEEEVFNMQGGNAWFQFTAMTDQFVFARSCKAWMEMGWIEGYYVFAREGVDVGSLDLEQLRVETINSYGGWFQKMDVCPDSLPVVEGGVTPPVVQGGVLPP